jgi:DNA (cytosine-5)-methyltransferase 1
MRRLSVFSLFSGCGGLDLGFKQVGFQSAYACDNDPAAVDCFRRNVDSNVFLRSVESEEFRDDLEGFPKVDVVLGGFPCQGFSKAGPKVESDKRNQLYREMKHAVARLQPAIFVAENVDGMSQNFGGIFLTRIAKEFEELGYDVIFKILQAAEYGVPQYRRRIFFVGTHKSLKRTFEWPTPTHQVNARNGEFKIADQPLFDGPAQKSSDAPVSIADAIGDIRGLERQLQDHAITSAWPEKYNAVFRAIGEGQKLCNVRHAPSSVYTWMIPDVFGSVSPREIMILETIAKNRRHKMYGSIPNGNPLSQKRIEELSGLQAVGKQIESLLEKGYLKQVADKYDLKGAMFCSGLFKRPKWNEPAPTVLTNFHNPRYFLHPLENRPFSLRECARLQTFPDSFEIGGKSVDLVSGYRLIGNAVPPRLSALIAERVYNTIAMNRRKRARNEVAVSSADTR